MFKFGRTNNSWNQPAFVLEMEWIREHLLPWAFQQGVILRTGLSSHRIALRSELCSASAFTLNTQLIIRSFTLFYTLVHVHTHAVQDSFFLHGQKKEKKMRLIYFYYVVNIVLTSFEHNEIKNFSSRVRSLFFVLFCFLEWRQKIQDSFCFYDKIR